MYEKNNSHFMALHVCSCKSLFTKHKQTIKPFIMNKTNLIILLLCVLAGSNSFSQSVGVGTNNPNASAMLDVTSTTKGLLPPRMNTASRLAIPLPAEGLMVYDTDVKSFFVYNGTAWRDITGVGTSKWTLTGTNISNNNTGNVGIGMNATTVKLSVSGITHFYNGGEYSGRIQPIGDSLVINAKPGSGIPPSVTPGGNLLLQYPTNALERSGNVGIGMANPIEKLALNGKMGLYSGDVNYGSFQSLDNDFLLNATLGVSSPFVAGNDLILQYSSTNTTGRVGIGISSPLDKLHINGILSVDDPILPAIRLRKNGLQQGYFLADNNGHVVIGTAGSNTTGQLLFATRGTSNRISIEHDKAVSIYDRFGNKAFNVFEDGRVSIGPRAAQNYWFSVNGNMICEEVRVRLVANWPDYVFHQNYKLKSFDELRGFISLNQHLPNIPKAAEIEKNGMELGDMQKRMMEKIEELTLYILQLEERLKAIEKK
jgi:hypothetical protein